MGLFNEFSAEEKAQYLKIAVIGLVALYLTMKAISLFGLGPFMLWLGDEAKYVMFIVFAVIWRIIYLLIAGVFGGVVMIVMRILANPLLKSRRTMSARRRAHSMKRRRTGGRAAAKTVRQPRRPENRAAAGASAWRRRLLHGGGTRDRLRPARGAKKREGSKPDGRDSFRDRGSVHESPVPRSGAPKKLALNREP